MYNPKICQVVHFVLVSPRMRPDPIPVEADFDIPFTDAPARSGVLKQAESILGTAEFLEKKNVDVDYGVPDKQRVVQEMINSMQTNGESRYIQVSGMSPSTALLVREILGNYNYDLLRHADQIRNMVITKLIEQADNPRNQMQALHLLGKIPEVGLFSEKVVVAEMPKNSSEVQEKLREKLKQYINAGTISNAEVKPVNVKQEIQDLKGLMSDD